MDIDALFSHPFNKYLLDGSYAQSTISGILNESVNNTEDLFLWFIFFILVKKMQFSCFGQVILARRKDIQAGLQILFFHTPGAWPRILPFVDSPRLILSLLFLCWWVMMRFKWSWCFYSLDNGVPLEPWKLQLMLNQKQGGTQWWQKKTVKFLKFQPIIMQS